MANDYRARLLAGEFDQLHITPGRHPVVMDPLRAFHATVEDSNGRIHDGYGPTLEAAQAVADAVCAAFEMGWDE